jgi:hypothetical protein
MPIKLSINVTKIPRERIKPGKNGKYIDLVLFENKAGTDQYGNDGFISISVTKEEREAGTRGEIVGNWRNLGSSAPSAPARKPTPPRDPDLDPDQESDMPF